MKIDKKNLREIGLDFCLPIIIETMILGCTMFIHRQFSDTGNLLLIADRVGTKLAIPTSGRMILLLLSFLGFLFCTIAATCTTDRNNNFYPFVFGSLSGIFLWQAIGEHAWHFGLPMDNTVLHFVQLESVSSLTVLLPILLLCIYALVKHSFNFGIEITILSFFCNWLGHFVTLGTYPFVAGMIDEKNWNITVGVIAGVIAAIAGIAKLILNADTQRKRMVAGIFTYIGIATAVLSVIEG